MSDKQVTRESVLWTLTQEAEEELKAAEGMMWFGHEKMLAIRDAKIVATWLRQRANG